MYEIYMSVARVWHDLAAKQEQVCLYVIIQTENI